MILFRTGVLSFLSLFGGCVGFGQAEVRESIAGEGRTLARQAIQPGQVPGLVIRFTAWGNHERYVADVRERLRLRGYRLRSRGPDVLEIVLEESYTTPGALRFLNFLGTVATGTLLPFYNQVNYRLSYRHFRNGVLQSVCRYDLRNNELIGVLLVPLAPFRWSTTTLSNLLRDTADAYAYGCRSLDELPGS